MMRKAAAIGMGLALASAVVGAEPLPVYPGGEDVQIELRFTDVHPARSGHGNAKDTSPVWGANANFYGPVYGGTRGTVYSEDGIYAGHPPEGSRYVGRNKRGIPMYDPPPSMADPEEEETES